MTLKEFRELTKDIPEDAPIVSEINDEPMLLSDAYYDSVDKEIHIILC